MSDLLPDGVTDDDVDRAQGFDAREAQREEESIAADRKLDEAKDAAATQYGIANRSIQIAAQIAAQIESDVEGGGDTYDESLAVLKRAGATGIDLGLLWRICAEESDVAAVVRVYWRLYL